MMFTPTDELTSNLEESGCVVNFSAAEILDIEDNRPISIMPPKSAALMLDIVYLYAARLPLTSAPPAPFARQYFIGG